MALSTRIIAQPAPGVLEFFRQRMGKACFGDAANTFSGGSPAAIGLLQGKVVEMVAGASVAEKAASVFVFDVKGSCALHIAMFVIFGDLEDVRASIAAVKEYEKTKKIQSKSGH